MSDEEKKAITELKHYCNLTQYWKNVEYTKPEFDDYVKIILDLIEKQSKEIEALKLIHESYKEMIEENNYISKDKIKAEIEEYKWAIESYDCDEADYKQSQAVGA